MSKRRVSEESQLIDRALAGDAEAFGQLVRQHQGGLFACMHQVTRSTEETEDVVQEAFVRAYLKLDTFQRSSRFFTWLYRIAFNIAISRRRKKQATVSVDLAREQHGSEPADDVDAPDERMLREERVELVREALDHLSTEHRAVLALREMENCSYEEIAETLEISIGTVRSRLSRARAQLRSTLDAMQSEEQ